MNNEPKVIFIEKTHQYFMGDVPLQSVTNKIGEYFSKFDEEYWLTHGALKELIPDIKRKKKEIMKPLGLWKYPHFLQPAAEIIFPELMKLVDIIEFENAKGKLRKEWAEKRDTASEKGTEFHLKMERMDIERGYVTNPWDGKDYPVINPPKKYDNESVVDNLKDLEHGFYPELVIWDEELGICGQADRIWVDVQGDVKYVDGDDWKTNENKPDPNKQFKKALKPLDNLWENKHTKYNLQNTFYFAMLERAGLTPRNGAYTHITDYDENQDDRVDLPYLKAEFNRCFGL